MAAETLIHTLSNEEWTLIASGKKVVAIQLLNPASVRVHMADINEVPDEESPGIVIGRGMPDLANAWSAAGLPDDTGIWAMSLRDPAEDIVVMSY